MTCRLLVVIILGQRDAEVYNFIIEHMEINLKMMIFYLYFCLYFFKTF